MGDPLRLMGAPVLPDERRERVSYLPIFPSIPAEKRILAAFVFEPTPYWNWNLPPTRFALFGTAKLSERVPVALVTPAITRIGSV